MPESPLIAAGAAVEPKNEAPLHTNRFFSGLWTQRSPLRDGATPFLMEKYYSASRFDALYGGMNAEISPRMTLVRRPGQSIYNSTSLNPINRFYCFRTNKKASGQKIRVMASMGPLHGIGVGGVAEVTGPSGSTSLFSKSAGAGKTAFQSQGNILFMGDGKETNKWVQSALDWLPNSSAFAGGGDFIVDANNNIQEAVENYTGKLTNIQVNLYGSGSNQRAVINLFFDPSTPFPTSQAVLTLAGLTTKPALNGTTFIYTKVSAVQAQVTVLTILFPVTATAYAAETGTGSTGTGITGGSQPAWSTTLGGVTIDGTLQWICRGPSLQAWGFGAPDSAPTVTQSTAPSVYPAWVANTWFGPLFVIVDSNSNLQMLTTGGQLGGAPPAWNVTLGGTTADNTAIWTNKGPGAWVQSAVHAVGDLLLITYTYYITVIQVVYTWNGYANVPVPVPVQVPTTVTNIFQCTAAGTSGTAQPSWGNGVGTTTTDNTVGWTNRGVASTWATLGAAALVSTAQKIIDSNGYLEAPLLLQKTGGAAPTWATLDSVPQPGSITVDGSQNWINAGPFSSGNTDVWKWAYSGKNSVTGHIGTASPISTPLLLKVGNLPVLQGIGPTDPQEDVIVLWRTVQGGSLLIYDDEFQSPGAGQSWIYTDTNADTDLNELIIAPIAHVNDPPPSDFLPYAYHETRIWGFADNGMTLRYTDGPTAPAGSGDEAMSPSNKFNLVSAGTWCWATAIGLIIFRVDGISVLLGNGTSNNPFYIRNLYDNVGLASPDEITTRGNTCYFLSAAKKLLSLNTGQVLGVIEGAVQQTMEELEIGFPIGDQIQALYSSGQSYLTWHEGSSEDSALYLADGQFGWFRMHEVTQPEQCTPWSTQALIQGGAGCVASIEVSPGVRALLVSTGGLNGGPILMRDYATYQDNGVSFVANAIIGSIVLAQPGSQASVKFITLDYLPIGTKPSVGMLYDEIEGAFTTLNYATLQDPTNQDPSTTAPAVRYWAQQSQKSVSCRHMQLEISWPAENFANELLTYTIYGRLPEKAHR